MEDLAWVKGSAINLGFVSISKDELYKMDIPHRHLGTESSSKQKGYLGNNHHDFVKSSTVRCT